MALLKTKVSDYAGLTALMPIKDSEGNPRISSTGKPVTLTVLPMESKEFKKAKFDADEAYTDVKFRGKGGKDTPDKALNRRISVISAVVTDWANVEFEEDGKFEEFNDQNLRFLLTESPDNILDQIDEFIVEKDNFQKKTMLA
jgi:hypothetical protein